MNFPLKTLIAHPNPTHTHTRARTHAHTQDATASGRESWPNCSGQRHFGRLSWQRIRVFMFMLGDGGRDRVGGTEWKMEERGKIPRENIGDTSRWTSRDVHMHSSVDLQPSGLPAHVQGGVIHLLLNRLHWGGCCLHWWVLGDFQLTYDVTDHNTSQNQ